MTDGHPNSNEPIDLSRSGERRRRVTFRNALGWSYVMNGGQYLITTVITLVLAALLGPTVYGTVAMALVYVLFIEMLLQQGMVPAIVQRPDLRPAHLDTAFWMLIGASVALTGTSILAADWWAAVNRTPELASVIRWLSLLIPLKALILVHDALLRRAMRFRSLAVRSNVAALVSGGVGLVLALTGFGVWALVAQQVSKSVVELIVLWWASDWRPRVRFSPAAARDLLGYTAGASLASIGVFVNNRADALLIGLFLGPTAVGLYRFAARFVDMVIDITVRSLQAVSLPELARLQHDRAQFNDRAISIVRLSAVLALPLLGVLAGASDALIDLVGPEWSAASNPLKLLCVVGAVKVIGLVTGPLLQALGKVQVLALVAWGSAALSAASFTIAGVLLADASTSDQVLGMAASRLALFGVAFLALNLYLVKRVLRLPIGVVIRGVAPASLAAVVAFGVARGIDAGVPDALPSLLQAAVVAAPSLLGAVVMLIVVDPWARNLARTAFSRLRTARGGGATSPPRDRPTTAPANQADADTSAADASGSSRP